MAKKSKDETIEDFGADVEVDENVAAMLAGDDDISGELTEKEKIKLELEARREVAAAIKAAKMKDFKAAAKKRIQTEAFFSEGKDHTGADLCDVQLDLASYPKWIMLDGKRYHSGRKYRVKQGVAAVLLEQMSRGWDQEQARLGERTDWVQQKQKILSRHGLQEVAVIH